MLAYKPSRTALTHVPFDEARTMARSMGLSTLEEWREYTCPGAYRLPPEPQQVWPEEWKGWDDWLGTMLPLDEAKAACRAANLRSESEYLALVLESRDQDLAWRVPASPERFYGPVWPGWEAFLGGTDEVTSPPPLPPRPLTSPPPPPRTRGGTMSLTVVGSSVLELPAVSRAVSRVRSSVVMSNEAGDLEERLVKEILAQKATGREWDPGMVAGMEADLARVGALRADDDESPARLAGLPRTGSAPWGSWAQSADGRLISLELWVDASTRAADIRCECLVGFLDVRCQDEPLLSGRLAQEVRSTELEWTLEESNSDGKRALCIELPKRERSVVVDESGRFADAIFSSVRVASQEYAVPGLVTGKVVAPPGE